jgi:diguanylate cyclase (GGDEF)-like protein/PAS domain S-box-containing protein
MTPPKDKIESLAQEMLAAGEEHVQIARHPTRVVFWVADPDGSCELMSPNWSELTGQPVDAAMGDGWLRRVIAADRERVEETLRDAIATRTGLFIHYSVMRADGRPRRVRHDAAVRSLPSGKFNGLIATITDESDLAAGEAMLEGSRRRVCEFLDRVPQAAIAIGFDGRIVHANPVLAEVVARNCGGLFGDHWIDGHVSPADRELVRSLIDGRTPAMDLVGEREFHIQTACGDRLFRWHLTLLRDGSGHPFCLALLGTDITDWRRVGDLQRLTAQVFANSREAMVVADRHNRIITVNDSFTRLTGYSREEAIGQNPRILQSGKHDADFYRQMWDSLITAGFWRGDIWDKRKDGTLYPKFLAITVIRDGSGEVVNYSAIFYDITERKAFEEELDQLAHFDALTGLPNRMLLQDRLEHAIAGAERQQQHFALLFIDLDGFKPVNDAFGHAAGDVLLREVGRRLAGMVRAMDTAARLGGDEFVVILTDIRHPEAVGAIASKIVESLSAPYDLSQWTPDPVVISASIGISLYPDDERGAGALLRTADEAMYRAKREGKQRIAFHGGA